MTGPTPLTVTFRATWNYVSKSLPHVLRMYLDCVNSSDASGRDTVARAGYSNVGVSTIVDPLWTVLAPFYKPDDASFGIFLLEGQEFGGWIPLWSTSTTVVPTSANANRAAFGRCIACKTIGNKHLKAYFYESDLFVAAKQSAWADGSTRDKALWDYFMPHTGTAANTDAYAWRMNKGGDYTSRLLALIDDSNEKLRRVRHVK